MTAIDPTGQQKDFLGRGWANPVELDPLTGHVMNVAYEDDVRQSILIILQTSPGERAMRPNFGCGIHELVFSALDSTAIQRIKSEIQDALRRCEARIEVLGITVEETPSSEGRLIVELEYRVRRTNQVGNLVFPFYFLEGGRP